MTAEANRALYRRFWEALMTRDRAAIGAILAPDLVAHGPAGAAAGEMQVAFPGHSAELLDLIATDDRVVVRVAIAGEHRGPFRGVAATGKPVAFEQVHIYRVADGRFVERWAFGDDLAILRQIGAYDGPTPSTATTAPGAQPG